MNGFWDWSDTSQQGDDTRLTIAGVFWLGVLAIAGIAVVESWNYHVAHPPTKEQATLRQLEARVSLPPRRRDNRLAIGGRR